MDGKKLLGSGPHSQRDVFIHTHCIHATTTTKKNMEANQKKSNLTTDLNGD